MINNKGKIDPSNLIEISLNDFRAASILFDTDRELYPQAIYMLQQSLEKAIKAALVCLGLVKDEEELKNKIRHEASKRTLELVIDKTKESIIDSIYLILQHTNNTNEAMSKDAVWYIVNLTIPNLKNLTKNPTWVKDFIEGILSNIEMFIDNLYKQIDNEMDDKKIDELIQEYAKNMVEKYKTLLNNAKEFLYKFLPPAIFININQSIVPQFKLTTQSLESQIKLAIYTVTLIMLHAPLEELQAKLRYNLLDNKNYFWAVYKFIIRNIQYENNNNLLEDLKQIINCLKNN